MVKKILALFVLLLAIFFALFAKIYDGSEVIRIEIKPGMSVASIHKMLKSYPHVKNSIIFYRLSQLLQLDDELQAGTYLLTPNISAWQFLWKLKHGNTIKYKITFVEGWGFKQIQSTVNSAVYLEHTVRKISSKSLAHKLGITHSNVEGFLYPDTYYYDDNTTDLEIYNQAYLKMQKILAKQWSKRQTNLYYKNPYEALIVASLIEKESKYIPEQVTIAAVILNRLNKRMRLQIDAAVFYGQNRTSGTLSKKDLRQKTPYNLYTRYGLPPTPIAMPAESAIYAALHPAKTDVLFYVLSKSGKHIFNKSYKGHLKAIKNQSK